MRYASVAASFLLVPGVGTVLAYVVHSSTAPLPTAASTATATATGTATATATATPLLRAHYDVYLEGREGRTLRYVREPCTAADTALRFFARYYPVNASNLEGARLYNSVGFGFSDRGTRSGGRCETTLEMPSYDIKRVLTGQYGGDGAWREGFPLDAIAWRVRYDGVAVGTPRLRSTPDIPWDVYLNGQTLTWISRSCSAEDTALRFFVRWYPVDASNLEGERLYNDTGFGFTDRGLRYEGRCMARYELPNYAIERVLTGQYGGDGAWREGFPVDATAWRARYGVVVAGTPRLRSTPDIPWDVYLNGQTLTWISRSCAEGDTALRFFVRWYPVAASDLEGAYLYNSTGFGFTDRGLRYEGKCMAQYELPDYDIERVLTGQYGGDGAWREGFPVNADMWRDRYDGVVATGAPRLRSTRDGDVSSWDVYLDGRTLTWLRGSCVVADTAARFFVRWQPADAGNLQGERGRTRGYNDTGFGFTDRGLRYEGKCMASFDLPAYAVTRVITGQYRRNSNGEWEHPWEGGFDIAQATATATGTATAPVRPQQ